MVTKFFKAWRASADHRDDRIFPAAPPVLGLEPLGGTCAEGMLPGSPAWCQDAPGGAWGPHAAWPRCPAHLCGCSSKSALTPVPTQGHSAHDLLKTPEQLLQGMHSQGWFSLGRSLKSKAWNQKAQNLHLQAAGARPGHSSSSVSVR